MDELWEQCTKEDGCGMLQMLALILLFALMMAAIVLPFSGMLRKPWRVICGAVARGWRWCVAHPVAVYRWAVVLLLAGLLATLLCETARRSTPRRASRAVYHRVAP
ncbi:MAG: hypothetical protein Q4C88_05935 [Akkermansia sp.]|nr:hypothetical protein [Akkermansia sp.]